MENAKVPPESHSLDKTLDDDSSSEEEHSPLNKRQKLSTDLPLFKPLGLKLDIESFEKKLSEENASKIPSQSNEDASSTTIEKNLEPSEFTALLLRIGTWVYKPEYEKDLVVKCHYKTGKRIMCEFLDGNLKKKIEIHFTNITALKANYEDDGVEALELEVAKDPIFFTETNYQPKTQTKWKETSDFTDGQAITERRHYIECKPGTLREPFEKIIRCVPHLKNQSQQAVKNDKA